MSLLGEYRKQPVEVEVYGIQFAKDMSTTDEITSTFQVISRDADESWDQAVQENPYTILSTDDKKIIVSKSAITLSTDVVDGFHVCIANANQTGSINVDSFSVPARGSIVVQRVNGAWKVEAKTTAVLVNAVNDQRVRVWVHGGNPWEIYKVQVTVETTEGRVMQDEFTVEIEEV